ncbi:hypothetical protein FIBSPDRAFT_857165 [Athelia psychrophila]|uniref:SWI5-dependent HO expression protein 3 n=1 Tax=Athelia psychrophila TaxID=1759441 RepID=A0A166MZ11_9AGAM|nr:hypothetical protein FIBSPDRAFT_857165 [Fibularhizoctonia sp. CBS 109695]
MSVSAPLQISPQRPTSRTSRASSRSSYHSIRASSPALSLVDDPVAVRNHISSLKHSIRQQQAQLQTYENVILRGPRPYPPGINPSSMSHSPAASTADLASDTRTSTASESTAPSSVRPTTPSPKIRKKSSFDSQDSEMMPPPRREWESMKEGSIREGVPMEFGVAPASSLGHHKRVSSPTRTYSRIPVSSVGNARALADEGNGTMQPSIPAPNRASLAVSLPSLELSASNLLLSPARPASVQLPPSPNKRLSLTPGGTTKVLADLQTGVINARNALENTKTQLRVSQRSVAQLTRQTEDLKEGRERLRLENEGLNNVVARKERLLQEVLERARKAEAEAATLKGQLKSETTASKKIMRDMEGTLVESTALSQKSEREYITLRDSLKKMAEDWKADAERLRTEMTKRENKLKDEAQSMGKKYRLLVEELKGDAGKDDIASLRQEDEKVGAQVEDAFRDEIVALRAKMDQVSGDGEEANDTAKSLALELARLRRMMQAAGRDVGSRR